MLVAFVCVVFAVVGSIVVVSVVPDVVAVVLVDADIVVFDGAAVVGILSTACTTIATRAIVYYCCQQRFSPNRSSGTL